MRRIVALKLAVGAVLGLLAFATVGGLLLLEFLAERPRPVEAHVVVERADGSTRWNGTLLVDPPTPLGALRAAGKAAAFLVEEKDGRVVAVGAEAGGWRAEVREAGAWRPAQPDERLEDGAEIRWFVDAAPPQAADARTPRS